MTVTRAPARPLGILALLACLSGPLSAETRPTLNFYGATGLIDMPSGEAQPDGQLSLSTTHFGPISRTTLSFQVTPRLSASFRFLGIRDWNSAFCPPDCGGANQFETYYDRSFDIRYQVLSEGRYLPAVTVGLQDFAGTGVLSAEYVAATKHVTPRLKVTAGLGWGRLGSYGAIGTPFGERPPVDIGFGGNFNARQWFRGPAAPFGGVEWQIADRWGLKAEYSSDAYADEAGNRGTFDRRSPLSFGLEYQPTDGTRIGLYSLYGSQVGLAAHFVLNPAVRPSGGIVDGAPLPIRPRGGAFTPDSNGAAGYRTRLARLLDDDGIGVESFALAADSAELRIRNSRIDAAPQAIGRAARAMAAILPPGVDSFRIVPVTNGMATTAVTLRRADLEHLEFAADGGAALRARTTIEAAGPLPPGALGPVPGPRFAWSLGPYTRFRFFDQNDPIKADVGLRATASYDLTPSLRLQGAITQRMAGNLDERPPIPARGRLHPVRSAIYWYDAEGETALESLALHWHGKLGRDLYARASFGYLERMFGGLSTEVLWKPVGSRWALGAELNHVAQRSPDQGLGFTLPQRLYDTDAGPGTGPSRYSVTSGHVSGYLELAQGFLVQVDVGQYLAGDIGATLTVQREFANGWKVGAFATRTNVSAQDFGSGSFDKGIVLEVPFNWVLGRPTRQSATTVIRPFGRDGGQRLELANRLYDDVRGYHTGMLDAQWGRFWK
ncbi:MAG TPA: YjbH domain-containing protein [Paracoccaceae bacterium]|nr:YjbH domain-containing protein [Paracoccaceae bacterium]